jgi:alkylation response protein AidB-like acyl-CoA dehydrogenase
MKEWHGAQRKDGRVYIYLQETFRYHRYDNTPPICKRRSFILMTQMLVDRRDLDFVIWEQMNGEQYLSTERYRGFDRKMCDMIITEASALATRELLPTLSEGDRTGVLYEDGIVKVPKSFHRAYRLIVEGGWNNLGVPEEMGGQGAPPMVYAAATEYFMAANWSLFAYAGTGIGAAFLIERFGTLEQKETYARGMMSGR